MGRQVALVVAAYRTESHNERMKVARRSVALLSMWLALPFAAFAQDPVKPPTWGLHGVLLGSVYSDSADLQ